MKRIAVFLLYTTGVLALMTITARQAHAGADLSNLNKLTDVAIHETDGTARVVISFEKPVAKEISPLFFEKSVQIELPATYITPAKRKFSLTSEFAPTAAAYQMDQGSVRLRFFPATDGRKFADKYTASVDGNLLVYTFNTSKPAPRAKTPDPVSGLENLVVAKEVSHAKKPEKRRTEKSARTSSPKRVEEKKEKDNSGEDRLAQRFGSLFRKAEAAESVKEKRGEKRRSSATSKKLANEKGSIPGYEDPVAPEPPSMTAAAVKMVAALSLVLGFILLVTWLVKKYQKKFGGGFGGGGLVTILGTGAIGVKKQITIVDVAGEILVLGVAGENISMLSRINDQETAARLRRVKSSNLQNKIDRNYELDSVLEEKREDDTESLLKKTAGALRIGRVKPSSKIPPALIDETDEDTFAGKLAAMAERDSDQYSPRLHGIEVRGEKKKVGKEQLLKQVTNAIRDRNRNLKPA